MALSGHVIRIIEFSLSGVMRTCESGDEKYQPSLSYGVSTMKSVSASVSSLSSLSDTIKEEPGLIRAEIR